MNRLLPISLAMVITLTSVLSWCPAEAAFPTKPIELVVAFPAGGAADLMMRPLAAVVSKNLGQQVVVVNRGGGGGIIGSGEVARAKPNGYTILVMQVGPGCTQPHIGEVPYKIDDFEPLMLVFDNPLFLTTRANSPWKSAREFVDDAKTRPNAFAFGASPVGAIAHLVMEILAREGGFKVKIVPYQGVGPATLALLGGHIDVAGLNPGDVSSHVASGQMRLLGVFNTERLKEFPDVPTLREQGFDAVGSVWGGLVVPKGTPKDIQTKLHDAFKKGLESQLVKDAWAKMLTPTKYKSASELLTLWKTDYERYGTVIRDLKKAGRL